MSIEQNKKIILGFFEALNKGDFSGVLDMLAEDATWWTAGNLPSHSGTKTKQEIAAAYFKNYESAFSKPARLTVDHSVAKGDYVAVEAHSYAEIANGKIYNNKYHWKFEVRDGKIREVKAYMDTQHLKEILSG